MADVIETPEPARAVAAGADGVERFAFDLRELRLERGNPTLLRLSAATGISKSVISDALAGRRLPTQNTVGALVEALDGDRSAWLARRESLDPRTAVAAPVVDAAAGPSTARPRRTVSLRAALALALAAACLASLATAAVTRSLAPSTGADGLLAHADGVDPMQTVCREDAVIAASEERLDGDVLVQMMYSNQCMAVWGRVTRYDGEASGNELSMLIYPAVDLASDRNQERSAFDLQSIYTTLMIEPDVEARVCGIATVTQGAEPVELGPPICV